MKQSLDLGVVAVQFDEAGQWRESKSYQKNIVVPWNNAIWGSTRAMAAGEEPGVSSGWAYLCGDSGRPAYAEVEVNLYISPNGSGENTGLNADSPLGSYVDALKWLQTMDFHSPTAKCSVIINYLPGTYAEENIDIYGEQIPTGVTSLKITSSDPANRATVNYLHNYNCRILTVADLIFNVDNDTGLYISGGVAYLTGNIDINITNNGNGVISTQQGYCESSAVLSISKKDNSTGGFVFHVIYQSYLKLSGTIIASGAFQYLLAAHSSFIVISETIPIRIINGAYTITVYAVLGSYISLNLPTFSGSATGKRYYALRMSQIYTNGSGVNYIPGSIAGSADAASGGYYI